MADAEQLALIRRGVTEWNEWRKENPDVDPDLSMADLIHADLRLANLRSANLRRADLIRATLAEANLNGANLAGTDLTGAILDNADLGGSNLSRAECALVTLTGANLAEADLGSAVFQLADLSGANFSEARVGATIFAGSNLTNAVGLDACVHNGPTAIDYLTLARSWPLPEVFLRGCGLPDALITFLPSLLSDGAIQFYSCFISYSTKDQEFADRLYADLQNKGVRCWFAPHDVQAGRKLHEQIDAAIRMHERLLLILSPNSMSSAWVETEIRNARRRERTEKKRVLFPVRLASFDALREWNLFDADEGRNLAVEIREYYIPDFSQWKNHDLYKKELEKLLRDLKMDGSK